MWSSVCEGLRPRVKVSWKHLYALKSCCASDGEGGFPCELFFLYGDRR